MEAKNNRNYKKQMGQFMTPIDLSYNLVKNIKFRKSDRVLEPSFGDGSFLFHLIDKFIQIGLSIEDILNNNIWGVELDEELYNKTLREIEKRYGLPDSHNFMNSNYLTTDFGIKFDYIIGNPPFGGTIPKDIDLFVEKCYGKRYCMKIKKETYSMFIVKSIGSLNPYGGLMFILSDTFLTINTMKGLRNFLMRDGINEVKTITDFSDETAYSMVVLKHVYGIDANSLFIDGKEVMYHDIYKTDNFSWKVGKYAKYFNGDRLSKYITASGGMTTGKNEYFLREIVDNHIVEKYNFTFFDDIITLEDELKKSRLNKVSNKIKIGDIRRNVKIEETEPINIKIPNPDYCYYNKSTSDILYSKPKWVIYWKDDGDACITYKKNGNWYLHGVGGKPFFKKEGITWQLISSSIKARYLPEGYILDSGAPIAVLKDGIEKDELYFILSWLLSDLANDILKNVINHTRNIQGKDIERLPYPFWIEDKDEVIKKTKEIINKMMNDEEFDIEIYKLFVNSFFNI